MDGNDERIKTRQVQLLPLSLFVIQNERDTRTGDVAHLEVQTIHQTEMPRVSFDDINGTESNERSRGLTSSDEYNQLQLLWKQASANDEQHTEIVESLRRGNVKFPAHLGLNISMSHCQLSHAHIRSDDRSLTMSSFGRHSFNASRTLQSWAVQVRRVLTRS